MPQFRIKAGSHFVKDADGKRVKKSAPDVIELSDEEAAKFANKFERVAVVEDKPVPVVAAKPAAQPAATGGAAAAVAKK